MAVYTVLNQNVISTILEEYEIGVLKHFEPVSSGIENTNYFIWTESADCSHLQWVLTVFENLRVEALPFFNELTIHLSKKGFAVPAPQKLNNGQFIFSFNTSKTSSTKELKPEQKKYGVIVPKFEGTSVETPNAAMCQKIAIYTAKMHKALNDFKGVQDIQHSVAWCKTLVALLLPLMSQNDVDLLNLALERYQNYQSLIEKCSQGVVHGDLFRDNVLFDHGEISGVIDFYNAGRTAFLFDLAVLANDWAVNVDQLPSLFSKNESILDDIDLKNIYSEQKLNTLVQAYESEKPFSKVEIEAWPRLLELAAFRFWLSRLKTKYLEGYQQDSKAGDTIKSPNAMKMIMLAAMAR